MISTRSIAKTMTRTATVAATAAVASTMLMGAGPAQAVGLGGSTADHPKRVETGFTLSGKDITDRTPHKPKDLGSKCKVPSGAKAKKVIYVNGTGGANATVQACEKWEGNYYEAHKAKGHVGYNGIAAKNKKREGDGKTPSGVFDMGYGFGVKAEPKQFGGSKYVKVTKDHVWVDGNATKGYNTLKRKSDGYKGESMYQTPAYNYGQVVNYNPKNTPGKGSGIFLHVNTGSGKTAGCVSVSQSAMLTLLDWEGSDSAQMAIVK